MTNRTRSATLLGAACLVAVAGCGSDPEPKVLPSLSSTPVTTTAPTASAGSVEAEVEAAVRHYYLAMDAAVRSGQSQELRKLILPGCSCMALVEQAEHDWAEGRVEGGHIKLTSIRLHDVRDKVAGVEIRASVSPYKRITKSGSVTERSTGGAVHNDLSLVRTSQGWRVAQSVDLG